MDVGHPDVKAVQVSTVDAFQGAEKEITILSCVRTRQVGFIDSEKRMNVALTRGRRHLLIVGSLSCLRKNRLWGRVIQHCEGKKKMQLKLTQGRFVRNHWAHGPLGDARGDSNVEAPFGKERFPCSVSFQEGKTDCSMQASVNHSWTIFLKTI